MKPNIPSDDKAHIIPADCVSTAMQELLVKCCPAGLYRMTADGRLLIESHGCLECGTCRLLADEHTLVSWCYSAVGSGIQYRFG